MTEPAGDESPHRPGSARVWIAGSRLLFMLVLLVAAITVRVVWAGEGEIAKSSDALRAGDADDAIVHARAAALWYAPAAPHVRVAYGRLMALGREAEQRKAWRTALAAYRAVVTSFASTRWLIEPHRADAAEAEAAIARIEAKSGARAPLAATEPAAAVEQAQLTALATDVGPSAFWKLVLAASFLAMLAGLAIFLRLGLDETGRVQPARALPALAAAALGLVGYCAALLLA